MTPSFEGEKFSTGCPCGRSHAAAGVSRRQRRGPEDHDLLVERVYDAAVAGELQRDDKGRVLVDYARDCLAPISIPANSDRGALFVLRRVRCRKCKGCLRARTNYWGFAAMQETLAAQESGRRTWFGTLTLRPEIQQEFVQRAFERWAEGQPTGARPAWWDDAKCDERFRLVRAVCLEETQRYWKRLRKAGHRFKYFLVFERHKSGLPHMHFLLHEQGEPIRKAQLQAQWAWGFSNVSIVGGKSRNAAAPEKAAWYVVKYLSKSYQARQVASRLYRPAKRG